MNHKKSLVDADASPSIHASIHRSIVSPTAVFLTKKSAKLPELSRAAVGLGSGHVEVARWPTLIYSEYLIISCWTQGSDIRRNLNLSYSCVLYRYLLEDRSLGVGVFSHRLYVRVFICGIFAAQSVVYVLKTKRTPNSVVFSFRLGKGLFSQDLFVSGIINYNFGLSAFMLPKSGVKMRHTHP